MHARGDRAPVDEPCSAGARVLDTGPMLVCHHRAPALAAVLSMGACLPDEGPLFEPVSPANEADPVATEPAPAPAAAPAAPGATAEQAPTPRAIAPAAASEAPTDSVGAAPDAVEPAAASAVPSLCDGPGIIACDTFEAQPVGVFPSGPAWLPELSGCGTHFVDDTGPAASGVRALRASDGGYPECMLHADLGAEDEVFVRTSVFLGADGDLVSQYVSLIELGVGASQDDPELRVGLRPAVGGPCDGNPGLDFTGSGLVGGTATECSGVLLEAERWFCLEVHLSRTDQRASLSVSVDGDTVLQREVVEGAAWAEPGLFVKLGRAAYGESGQGSLWHDDVVVSREPVPCQPPAMGVP